MIIFRTVHIIITWIVVEFIITDHSAEGGKFAIYNTKLKRGYPGVAHSITCELVTGYVKLSTDFIAPNGRAVLSCSKHATVCTVKKDGYSLGRLLQRGYVLAIHHFNVSRDTGIWQCRDKGYTGPDDIASVEVKSAPLYDVASNNLPEQRNYQEEYDMRITSNCTYGAPLCQWTITGLSNGTQVPTGVDKETLKHPCGDNIKYTCRLYFGRPPEQFMDRVIMFSITIHHPSIPGVSITPRPTPFIDFPRVRLELKASNMIPAEKYPLNLTCSVFQFGRLTGRIELLRKERGGKREQYAYVDQLKKGCGRKNFSAGHDIVCGAGTESAINYRRDYIFLFYKIRKADFVFWTCSTAEKYSKTINLMPFIVRVEISTTNEFPVKNAMVHIMCIILQQGTLTGAVQFFRRQTKARKGQKVGKFLQKKDGCTPDKDLPVEYTMTCGLGTDNARTAKKMYKLEISKVIAIDYAYWYCHHQTANKTSRELRLAPFRVMIDLIASDFFPTRGSEVNLLCTISKVGKLLGQIQFFRMSDKGVFLNFAHLRQTQHECVNKVAPVGYGLTCSTETNDALSSKLMYTLKVDSVHESDYTTWYCYQRSEDYISQNVSLAPYLISLDMDTTDTNPPLNTTAYLTCTVMQYKGGVKGRVFFYSRNEDKTSRKMGYIIQDDNKCSVVMMTQGYSLNCGDGTKNKLAKKKVYIFVITSVVQRDYTYWYCRHAETKKASKELLLGPSSGNDPEHFVGGLGGGIIAVIIVSALMAAAVPTAASTVYYKRRKKRLAEYSYTDYDWYSYTAEVTKWHNPVIKTEPEPEPEPEPETESSKSETEIRPKKRKKKKKKKKRNIEPESESEPEPKPKRRPKPKPQPQQESWPDLRLKPFPKMQPGPQYMSRPEPQQKSEPEPEYMLLPEPPQKSEPEPEYMLLPEPPQKSEPEPEYMLLPEPPQKSEPEPEYMLLPEPPQKSEPEPEYMLLPEPEQKSEPEPQYKSLPEPEQKSEPEPQYKLLPDSQYKSLPEPQDKSETETWSDQERESWLEKASKQSSQPDPKLYEQFERERRFRSQPQQSAQSHPEQSAQSQPEQSAQSQPVPWPELQLQPWPHPLPQPQSQHLPQPWPRHDPETWPQPSPGPHVQLKSHQKPELKVQPDPEPEINQGFTVEDEASADKQKADQEMVYEFVDFPEAEETTQFNESDFWHSWFKD